MLNENNNWLPYTSGRGASWGLVIARCFPLYEDKLSDSFGVETLAEIGGGAGARLRMGGEK
jgi:hypothetical protein